MPILSARKASGRARVSATVAWSLTVVSLTFKLIYRYKYSVVKWPKYVSLKRPDFVLNILTKFELNISKISVYIFINITAILLVGTALTSHMAYIINGEYC